jgi:putative transposase
MIETATGLASAIGTQPACRQLGLPRSTYYRSKRPRLRRQEQPKRLAKKSGRALSQTERAHVRDLLNSDRFCDASPRQVYARLLDEGRYVCHWRTMYRILAEHDEVRERRNQLRRPRYKKPELLARGPNELWSWDITKLRGPAKWTYFYLYVILDVYSRYVVGWMIAPAEQATLAKELIETTCERQGIARDGLIIHSDRGPSMRSKTVAQLLADLGVEKSHSRPYVSNDNPYSEAQFKTMKYRPDYPSRFGSIEDARQWARRFFRWYNQEHYHSGLALMTPQVVHYGEAERVRRQRQQVLSTAYSGHPERFVRGRPSVAEVPAAVWINAPKQEQEEKNKDEPVVVVAAVDAVVRPEQRGGLSTSPRPVPSARRVVEERVLLH